MDYDIDKRLNKYMRSRVKIQELQSSYLNEGELLMEPAEQKNDPGNVLMKLFPRFMVSF